MGRSSHQDLLDGLPPEWAIKSVAELGDIYGGSTPSRAVARYWNGDIPWVTPGELTSLRTKYLLGTREGITKAGLASCGAQPLPRNTLLITTRASIGAVALASVATATNQGFRSVCFRAFSNPHFYFHLFRHVTCELERRASGTTFLEISAREFSAVRVPAPPGCEQERIAEVLDTIDEAIRKTEAIVAKLEQLKQGLRHDLLTRGLDDNGELRDPDRHPEQFKESPLGRVPKAWDIVPLRQCLLGPPTNGIYKPAHQIGRGTLLIGQTAFTSARSIDLMLARRAVVNAAELERFGVIARDILVSRVFATVDGVGQPVLVPPLPEPAVYESNMMRLRVNQVAVLPELLSHMLQTESVRKRIVAGANSSNQTSINQPTLNALPIALAPAPEQGRILGALAAAEARHSDEQREVAKVRLLKRGLMEDLLTGRVRVTPLLAERQPTAEAR